MGYSLSYYQNRKTKVKNQIIERKKKNEDLKKDIQKLQKSYDALKIVKKNAQALERKLLLQNCAGNLQWRGKGKSDFDKKVDKDVKKRAKEFTKSIDNMMDAINKEKSRRQGQYDTGLSLLNSLNRTYRWLVSTIKNLNN